jgi:hypothetical protein
MVRNRSNASYEAKRRRSVRTPTPPLEAALWGKGQARSAGQAVTMKNIGAGGVLMSATAPRELGDMVRCSFKLPGGETHTLGGNVVRCEASQDGNNTFDIAVAFTSSQSSEAQLVRWVFSWIALQESIIHKGTRATNSEP